jgi:hypothetical protein
LATERCTKMIERCTIAHQMRLEGKSYNAISKALGVSETRARQLYFKYHDIKNRGQLDDFSGLRTSVANSLTAAGYKTREQVQEAIRSGAINNQRHAGIPGLGQKGYLTLIKWLGIQ